MRLSKQGQDSKKKEQDLLVTKLHFIVNKSVVRTIKSVLSIIKSMSHTY